MWSEKVNVFKKAIAGFALGASFALSACTVQPLEASGNIHENSAALSGITLAEPKDRLHQLLYNALIDLGANAGSENELKLENSVSESVASSALRPRTSAATIGRVSMTSNWKLVDTKTGSVLGTGSANGSASFDLFGQETANMQALQEARSRAAKQVALRMRPMILRAKSNQGG